MNACTVTVRGRLPYARVLAETFLAHHPHGRFTALVLDDPYDEQWVEGLEMLAPADIGLSATELHSQAMLLGSDDLAMLFVPNLLTFITKSTGEPCTYLADDVLVLGDLDRFGLLATEHGLVLSPRTLSAFPVDDRTPDQAQLLNEGLYNPGLVAVSPDSIEFLEWWSNAMRNEIRRNLPSTTVLGHASRPDPVRFSRILDMAIRFDHALLNQSGDLVSFWNAWDVALSKVDTRWHADGSPLLLFRFEGFDPQLPHLLGAAQGDKPRVLLSERLEIAELIQEYAGRLVAAGSEEASKLPAAFEFLPGGLRLDRYMRFAYRKAYRAYLYDRAPTPPDPFDQRDPDGFIDWLNAPDENGFAPLVPRYLMALYEERLDLRFAFPGLAHADTGRYLDWVVQYGAKEVQIPPELCRFDQTARNPAAEALLESPNPGTLRKRELRPAGLNVAGYFKAESGVGEMARLILSGVEQSGIPHSTFAYQARLSRQNHSFQPTGRYLEYGVNLICVNADELYPFVRDVGQKMLSNRYNVVLWWWELEELPEINDDTSALFDEVWVGTKHVAKAVRARTDKPVRLLPVPIRKLDIGPDRAGLGLPEGFLFLFTFDFLSAFTRKNPLGVIEAFSRAFRPNEGPVLVIKSVNGTAEVASLEMLRLAATGRQDIVMMDGYLPPERKDALIASCDSYVSLHRAEGYGLGMAEAVALGKPVIATNYSGNLTFLNPQNSYLVNYETSSVPAQTPPYREGATWAEPDLDDAAAKMRHVYENQEEAAQKGRLARQQARSIHTPERTAEFIRSRMTEIRRIQLLRQQEDYRRQLKAGLSRRLGFQLTRGSGPPS